MNDDDLRAALSRRAASPLSADERNDVLRAARLAATQPTRRSLVPRLGGAVLAIAATVVLAIIALPILLSPPGPVGRGSPTPGNTLVAEASASASATSPQATMADGTPTRTQAAALPIASAQALADLIGDPSWVGKTVLAQIEAGQIEPASCSPPPSGSGCGYLSFGNRYGVSVGQRDSNPGQGVQVDDGNGYHWVTPLGWPADAGVYAFKVDTQGVEYLGPAQMDSNGQPFEVSHFSGAKSNPTDDVFVVDGWLGHTLEAPCAFPQQGLASPMPDISSYYCGGSWLADHQWDPSSGGLSIDGGLHVQNDANSTYAPDPDSSGLGGAPQQGTYLIRNAGCPEVVTGDCPVWRMVGRLDVASGLQPSPSPSSIGAPPVHVSNETALTLNVEINGNTVATSQPQTESEVDPSAYPQPWRVTVTTSSGRQLIDFSYSASDIVCCGGNSEVGTAQRVDLSCGRLDVYAGPPLLGPGPPSSFPPHDCDEAASPPIPPPIPATSAAPSPNTVELPLGITLDQAIEAAREHVVADAQLWGYAAGTYKNVLGLTPEAGRVPSPPDGLTWDSLVWGIQFESIFDICPPASGDGCTSRPGLDTVFIDYSTGAFIESPGYSPSGPLPTPFFVVPSVASPAPS